MIIVYSPSAHAGNQASGFYLSSDVKAPSDAFAVSSEDHNAAINLGEGWSYDFIPPESPGLTGTLVTKPPARSFVLSRAKMLRTDNINATYIDATNAPITYMGTSFQADAESQRLIAVAITASGGQLPEGFVWYDVDNKGVPMSFAELQGLASAIFMRGLPLLTQKQALKAAARSAKTEAEVEAVTWS
jgi:hypothetical protein